MLPLKATKDFFVNVCFDEDVKKHCFKGAELPVAGAMGLPCAPGSVPGAWRSAGPLANPAVLPGLRALRDSREGAGGRTPAPLSSPCHAAILSLCKVLRVGRQQDQAHHLEPPCSQRAWHQVVTGPAPPLELGPPTEPHCFCQMAFHFIQTSPLSVHRDLRWGDRRGPWQAMAAASLWAEHSLTPAASVNIGSMNE